MRFYPAELPSFDGEPTRDRFEIRRFNSRIGEGVTALIGFEVGEIVFAFSGFLTAEPTKYTLQATPTMHVHDPFFMGKVLHHCDPNCVVDMERRLFIARRAIRAGDRVTMDYDQTEDVLFRSFTCDCGAPDCRGVIRGRLLDGAASPRPATAALTGGSKSDHHR